MQVAPIKQDIAMESMLATKPRWLWVGKTPVPPNVRFAVREIGELVPADQQESLSGQLVDAPRVLVRPGDSASDPHFLSTILNELEANGTVAIFLLPADAPAAWRMVARRGGQFLCVEENASPDKIEVQLRAASVIHSLVGKFRRELDEARHLSNRAVDTIEELDEEMRIAARLQRDFLPRRLPEVGAAKFGVLYRPVGWVSGDIYDVVRLDETMLGFYVADVVGHGMPAALMTMFVKKALQTKRIVGDSYEIVPPHISMRELNRDICEQHLPSCQFCTAIYCVLDTEKLTLTYARGGHPEPMVVHPNGEVERLWVDGSLLGIFEGEEFPSAQYQLSPGDRLVLYTDGAEDILSHRPSGEMPTFEQAMSRWGSLTREEMLLQLAASLDLAQDSDPPEDDVTVLVMDIAG